MQNFPEAADDLVTGEEQERRTAGDVYCVCNLHSSVSPLLGVSML